MDKTAGTATDTPAESAADTTAGAPTDTPTGAPTDTPTDTPGAPRSVADRIARQLLRLEGVAPRALMPMRGSLLISAIRCVLSYAILPGLAPLVGLSGAVSRPVSIGLSAAAMVLAIVSLRRVWAADWNYRWAYTAFTLVVLVLTSMVVVIDIRALTA